MKSRRRSDGHTDRAEGLELGGHRETYWRLSAGPWHTLLVLLPLIIAYQVGSAVWLTGDGVTEQIKAYALLSQLFDWFGVQALFVPAVLMVVVLLVWQVLSGDGWRVKPGVLAGMVVESVVWTVPLLLIGNVVLQLLGGVTGSGAAPVFAALTGSGGGIGPAMPGAELGAERSLAARATIAIGAGLYEEFLFRLAGIVGLYILLVDVLEVPKSWGRWAAVGVSAVAFALYHDIVISAGLDVRLLVYYAAAGVYFGVLFVLRGLGVTVLVHLFYNLAVLVLFS